MSFGIPSSLHHASQEEVDVLVQKANCVRDFSIWGKK